jgi:hypothetical protein
VDDDRKGVKENKGRVLQSFYQSFPIYFIFKKIQNPDEVNSVYNQGQMIVSFQNSKVKITKLKNGE